MELFRPTKSLKTWLNFCFRDMRDTIMNLQQSVTNSLSKENESSFCSFLVWSRKEKSCDTVYGKHHFSFSARLKVFNTFLSISALISMHENQTLWAVLLLRISPSLPHQSVSGIHSWNLIKCWMYTWWIR